mgnify:CR=1 FL=1
MQSLRFRLLASYIVLLLVTIGAIGVAIFVTTGARAAPPQQTYDRLAALMRGLNLANLVAEFRPNSDREVEVGELIESFAATRDVRVIGLNYTEDTYYNGTIIYDSAGTLEIRTDLQTNLDPNYRAPNQPLLLDRQRIMFGSFEEDGVEWLFSAVLETRPRGGTLALMVASERPTESLQELLLDFGADLSFPVLQGVFIGVLIAAILAVIITRTIARPLRQVSDAAIAIAHGDLNQQAPISGPTEVRSVAVAFNHMSAEVLAAQQAQRDFMANVSHDLKTPLTSIQGYSQAIIDGTAKAPERAAEIIYDEASRLTRMVIQLTDLARMQAGQLSMHKVPVNVGEIARTVAQNMLVVAQKKNINLQIDSRPLPKINGDGDRIVQVLNNLIGNAIKYTQSGGRVLIRTREREDGVECIISDNGPGIPEKDLPRIFERFYQVDKARGPSRGTGLGLAITHEIVLMHSGTIGVQSIEGQGTQFTIWLPFDV